MYRAPCRFPSGPLLRTSADLDLENLSSEHVAHLSRARVVIAEYDILQHDFPELSDANLAAVNPRLQRLHPEERDEAVRAIIDAWIIDNAAYISTTQAAQTVVNTRIITDDRLAVAFRPPHYGRAIVIPTRETELATIGQSLGEPASRGLLDLKGAGVSPKRSPANTVQANGLEYVGLALSDFLIQKAIDEILARELPTVWTVPVYAILDLGFDIVDGYHGTGPAGMHVRRAHRRRITPHVPTLERTVTFEIESVLRRYGITAATRGLQLHVSITDGCVKWQRGSQPPFCVTEPQHIGMSLALLRNAERVTLDQRDIQLARDVSWPPAGAQIVDFGAIRVESNFDCPMVRDFVALTLDEVVWPGETSFIQPNPDLQLPVDIWNRYRLKSRCFAWANEFRRMAIGQRDVRREIDRLLLDLTARWYETPTVTTNGEGSQMTRLVASRKI